MPYKGWSNQPARCRGQGRALLPATGYMRTYLGSFCEDDIDEEIGGDLGRDQRRVCQIQLVHRYAHAARLGKGRVEGECQGRAGVQALAEVVRAKPDSHRDVPDNWDADLDGYDAALYMHTLNPLGIQQQCK